ncbi:hypothetical protein ANCCAN_20097 [Ancylostoma caninum]|uniref:G-protein coupled receptors family 1 profile domain-containing protein n=1 Tax=Ancylostoma caninum TaxID=29170 RepID=A0A368FPG1_ANCCA|nr:hypothetical protein ANCCAN_20097 [Ancylostoma caninum]
MDEPGGRTFLSDVIVGSCMMVLSVVCGCAYSLILVTIWRDGELLKMPSYKFMFALGIFDVIQCFPHFVTGIFTIFQSVFSPVLAKAMGVLATPAYVAYAVLTIMLSFNRFIQIYSPRLDAMLFTGRAMKLWMGFVMVIWFLFAISLASPWAAIVYLPDAYGWDYDYTLKFSYYVQKVEMVIELSTILFSAVFYIFVIIALYRTRKRFLARSDSKTEVKILIQAFVITAYCTVLNFLWHNSQALLPASIWTNLALNMMWILNSGVYPLIYFIVNKAIRDRIAVKKSTIPTVSMFTRAQPTKHGSSAVADADAASNCRIIRKHLNGDATLGNAIKSNPKVQFFS